MMGSRAREEFRFQSRADYERELVRLIELRRSAGKKPTPPPGDDDEYDILMDEYLSFCADGADG